MILPEFSMMRKGTALRNEVANIFVLSTNATIINTSQLLLLCAYDGHSYGNAILGPMKTRLVCHSSEGHASPVTRSSHGRLIHWIEPYWTVASPNHVPLSLKSPTQFPGGNG